MNWNDFFFGMFIGYVSTIVIGFTILHHWPRRRSVHMIYRKGQPPERVR